jgi:hypothetical protein
MTSRQTAGCQGLCKEPHRCSATAEKALPWHGGRRLRSALDDCDGAQAHHLLTDDGSVAGVHHGVHILQAAAGQQEARGASGSCSRPREAQEAVGEAALQHPCMLPSSMCCNCTHASIPAPLHAIQLAYRHRCTLYDSGASSAARWRVATRTQMPRSASCLSTSYTEGQGGPAAQAGRQAGSAGGQAGRQCCAALCQRSARVAKPSLKTAACGAGPCQLPPAGASTHLAVQRPDSGAPAHCTPRAVAGAAKRFLRQSEQAGQASQQQRSRQAAPQLSAVVLAPHAKGGGAQNVALASMHAYLHGGVCAYKDVGGGAHAAANQHRLPNLLRGGS